MFKLNKSIILSICSLFFIGSLALGQDYDILIKGGVVIDARNNINKVMDVAIRDGKIAQVSPSILQTRAKKTIDASGLIVTPGLLDIHGHNFFGTQPKAYLSNSFSSLPPDGFTFKSGVTTIVDAGGSGWKNFETFKEQTIDRSQTRVLAFINIIGSGMKGGAIEQNITDMDAEATANKAKQYPGIIIGIKLAHYSGPSWTPTDLTIQAGTLADIPVMIDFGGSDPELNMETLLLEKLRPGDIFTHCYARVKGRTPLVDSKGKVRRYVFAAQKKGVIFDVGHGGGSFSFKQAIPATEQGFWPNSISTDLHTGSMNGGMKDLTNIMSKFLNMGMPLKEVVKSVTWNPAQYIKRKDLGHLSEGAVADITLLKLSHGDFGFIDTEGLKMMGNQKLICELTLREGEIVWDLNGMASPLWNE
ncbi:amidohydrolase/deacetylase family metallohydrolase [Aestuariivivens sediminis]|uniref:amidohydrolase/deacetylase family metallohydrolase n=1 Tax=Aestuariivivens sediminis TaxID=2913557 RepID=UPI001F5A0F95|nr:amidohydrolase/deacetylase family metallohydrolase [Aestuariivivens sediminis]